VGVTGAWETEPVTPPAARRTSAKNGPAQTWDTAALAPVMLVQGAEGLLVDRAVQSLTAQALERDASLERTRVDAAAYQAGQLSVLTSPSLFGEARLVVVDGVEATTDALITDALAYLQAPEPDVWVLFVHHGGVRGKKLLDGIKASGAGVVQCDLLKKDAEKLAFAADEFRRARRRATTDAVRALVQAVGADLRELAAACAQLTQDVETTIDETVVNRYYGGRVEVSGFKVADAAAGGQPAEAAALLRHALATGADPVPLVAALAMKLRTLAKVATLRGRGADEAKTLGLAPWQIDRARKELSRWSPETLAEAITATARADAEVKGASRDPVFAVERAVLTVARLASSAGRR